MSKVQAVSVVSFLTFSMILGALVFSRGFLLNRQIIHETAGPCLSEYAAVHIRGQDKELHVPRSGNDDPDKLSSMSNWCNPTPPFPKLILILVDALRFDFVQRMEFLSNITTNSQKMATSSCMFKFVADPPTTTMQRLKALMTGTMPTFIDASANFNSYEIEEDSLIYQLYTIGKRIAFLGDDTWLSLFPQKYFKSRFVEAHPSFNAWDLDTVDKAVNKTLHQIFERPNDQDWDVLVSHLLGVDHCGHRYGPNHPEMVRKLGEADSILKHVFNSMSSDTLLVIFGDHGMTSTGDHGGDSKDETESAVIFLSKQFSKYQSSFQCSSQLTISQIDLVPTLAPLLGIPIPYSNIGQLIPEFLQTKVNPEAVAANVAQVNKYIQHFPTMTSSENSKSEESLIQQYKRIQDAFAEYQSIQNATNREQLTKLADLYLRQVKAAAVSTWTQFNLPMIYTGVIITLLSVFSLFLYLECVPLNLKKKPIENGDYYSVLFSISWLWPSLSHWSVLCTFVYHSVSSTGLLGIIVSTLSGLLVFLILLFIQIIHTRKTRLFIRMYKFSVKNILSIISISLYMFTCLAVFSNSFTINEGYVLGFTLTVVVFIQVASIPRELEHELDRVYKNLLPEDNQRTISIIKTFSKCSWSCCITLIILLRISQIFFRCREEQITCTEDFLLHKQLSSLPEDWFVHKYFRYGIALLTLAIFVVNLRYWMIYRCCTFSKKPRAIITRFVPSMLVVLLGAFWALQGLPYVSMYATKIPLLMNYLPLVYQTVIVLSIACIYVKPICCIGHFRNLPYFNDRKIERNNLLASGIHERNDRRKSDAKSTKKMSNGTNQQTKSSKSQVSSNAQVNRNLNLRTSSFKDKHMPTSIILPYDICGGNYDCSSEDTYSSCLLTLTVLVTLLLVQVTSIGIVPAIIIEAYSLVCLVGIFRKPSSKDSDSWSAAVAWTLASQYFFYASGHQPIFSAIPWDSAFVGGSDTLIAGAWVSWARAGLAVVGNLHISQILASISLPLLIYWSVDEQRLESVMGRAERQKAYVLYGKFLALHGLKLLMCMCCAGWHRRHLMVWKIFAPKFIFEAVSFIITCFISLLGMVTITRLHFCHQNQKNKIKAKNSKNI